ncbi:MAG: carbohydrate ABC transporter permease [Anaerolineae bacterium]|nr:carbohydrate ABC transporter permease [Anaerolineae bacterium]MDW8100301.1 carbohydrate ABC transporter permease [Anaerolineae bacterium]
MIIRIMGYRLQVMQIVRFAVLTILALVWLIPMLWLIVTSFKPEPQILEIPPRWLPDKLSDFTIAHYVSVLFEPRRLSIGRAFVNTMQLCLIIPTLGVTVSALAAYAFGRLQFPGRDPLFLTLVLSMIIPGEILLVPNFVTVWKLGWLNTYHAIIWPSLAGAGGVFMMRQFLLGIPTELEEAARIDGCSRFGIFYRIVLPLIRGAIITQLFFSFLGTWNNFTWPYIVLNELEKMTLPVALVQLKGTYWSEYGLLTSSAAIAALPPSLIFILSQRLIIRSITLTGIKG